MKAVVLLLLAGIVLSLGSGLFFLVKDKDPAENSTRLLTSLKIRVALSVTLIVLLVASFALGWIQPPR